MLKKAEPFVVRDSRAVSVIAGLVFLAMAGTAFANDDFTDHSPMADTRIIYAITIIPAIYFFFKAIKSKVVLEINTKGIFYYNSLVTDWAHFISATYDQDEVVFSMQDNFYLMIEYHKPGTDKVFATKIKLPNTLNKAEEDIIEAIKKYCPGCQK